MKKALMMVALLWSSAAFAGKSFEELKPKKQIEALDELGFNVEGGSNLGKVSASMVPLQYRVAYEYEWMDKSKFQRKLSEQGYQALTDAGFKQLQAQFQARGIELQDTSVLQSIPQYQQTEFKTKGNPVEWLGSVHVNRATGTKVMYKRLLGAMAHITKFNNQGGLEGQGGYLGVQQYISLCRVQGRSAEQWSGHEKNTLAPCITSRSGFSALGGTATWGANPSTALYAARAAEFGLQAPEPDLSGFPEGDDRDYAREVLQLLWLQHELGFKALELRGGR